MRASSLALRLFFSAAAWTVVMLVSPASCCPALSCGSGARVSIAASMSICARWSPTSRRLTRPASVSRSRLASLCSSCRCRLVLASDEARHRAAEVRSSRSLWDSTLPHLDDVSSASSAAGARQGYVQGPEEQMLRLVERTIDLGDEGDSWWRLPATPWRSTMRRVASTGRWAQRFAVIGIMFLLITTFQVRFGLAPLKRISAGLASIRSGAAERLEGSFPIEVAALARDTNALIEANREIVTRARTHVGNLAHALKTPLSVMMNEASANPENTLASKIREQTDIMRDQVAHSP